MSAVTSGSAGCSVFVGKSRFINPKENTLTKKLNLMLMFVLACSMSAFAQSGMSSDSSMQNGKGKNMSMTGCIAEKDGKYMLQTKKHPDGIQLMSSEDLKPTSGIP
jgi:hypothetical protein